MRGYSRFHCVSFLVVGLALLAGDGRLTAEPPETPAHGNAATLENGPVELVGFYSDKHLGIFTCGGNLHVHMRSADGKLSGHLDEVELAVLCGCFCPSLCQSNMGQVRQ